MKIFKRFRKEREEAPTPVGQAIKKTELEEICGNDKEVYEALLWTLHFDPRRLGTIEKAVKKAEESGNPMEARNWYHQAGQLALYQGNIGKVKQFFGKCKELFPAGHYKILEIPERAVAKAQEYYERYLKEEEEK